MEQDHWLLANAKKLLQRAVCLMDFGQNYDEGIRCLRCCLEHLQSAPAYEPFKEVRATAIVNLGLAHIRKNQYDKAIEELAKIPYGISMREQCIPLVSIVIHLYLCYLTHLPLFFLYFEQDTDFLNYYFAIVVAV